MGEDPPMTDHPLLVPRRFCGPPSSGNGGWTAGALAALVPHHCPENRARSWPAVEVSLRRPPPLDTPMAVAEEDGSTVARHDGEVVARASVQPTTAPEPTVVEAVPVEEARAAMATYPGLTSHPFPTCFVCGTDREVGDGLRILPGRVTDQEGLARTAATWRPHPSVGEDFHAYADELPRASVAATWAALDCVGGWAGDLEERLMVLAAMTARIDALPVIGEEHVVMGLGLRQEGRKTFTAATIYDADGRVVGTAEHLWIAVDPAAFA